MAKTKELTQEQVIEGFKNLELHQKVDAFKEMKDDLDIEKKAKEADLQKLKEIDGK
jgi:hypothetical protein